LLRATAADAGRAEPLATPPPERGRSDCEAVRVGVNAQDDPSPPLRGDPPLSGEGEERAAPAAAIDRIERLVEQELAAEEACRARRAMRSVARAPSPFSPKPFRRWPACAAARPIKDYAMTTTFQPTSMSSVATLRAALTRSSQLRLTDKMLRTIPELRRWTTF